MPERFLIWVMSFVCAVTAADAQTRNWTVALAARGNITTTSRIYPNPEAPSVEDRVINTPLNSILSGSLEMRVGLPQQAVFLYLAVEYISELKSEQKPFGSVSPTRRLPVDEGYVAIPVEIGGHVFIPIGSRLWKLSMGGGLGAYYIERILRIAGVSASPVGNKIGIGIHVGIETQYKVLPRVSVIGTLKFRDPEMDVRNKFHTSSTTYEGNPVPLPRDEMKSRVNIDGLSLGLGIAVDLY